MATTSLLMTRMLRRSSGRAVAQAFMAITTLSAVTEPCGVTIEGGRVRLKRRIGVFSNI